MFGPTDAGTAAAAEIADVLRCSVGREHGFIWSRRAWSHRHSEVDRFLGLQELDRRARGARRMPDARLGQLMRRTIRIAEAEHGAAHSIFYIGQTDHDGGVSRSFWHVTETKLIVHGLIWLETARSNKVYISEYYCGGGMQTDHPDATFVMIWIRSVTACRIASMTFLLNADS